MAVWQCRTIHIDSQFFWFLSYRESRERAFITLTSFRPCVWKDRYGFTKGEKEESGRQRSRSRIPTQEIEGLNISSAVCQITFFFAEDITDLWFNYFSLNCSTQYANFLVDSIILAQIVQHNMLAFVKCKCTRLFSFKFVTVFYPSLPFYR